MSEKLNLNQLQWDIYTKGYIFCPNCGKKTYPEIPTFTDDNPDGTYICNECFARFTIGFEDYEK